MSRRGKAPLLPDTGPAIRRVYRDYERFIEEAPASGGDAKLFAAHHAACRAALAHVEHLIKLGRTDGGEAAAPAAALLDDLRRRMAAEDDGNAEGEMDDDGAG
ncbi:hypothetical protein M0638_08080 [Roseomonas sp. NAR14]|uniref:Uncharacterized protein n=1 Tax=Roseomonas acroporae TaxID=2937791 RepID=A0A9X2BVT7_9PROT|nr:hypothetical protein [Roseomonas acroporae]MCK8784334.1 hypothetical protein [Roseomonas acroporae]